MIDGFFHPTRNVHEKTHSTCLSIFYYIKEQAFSVLIFFGRPLLYLEHQSKQKNGYVSGQFLDRLSIVLSSMLLPSSNTKRRSSHQHQPRIGIIWCQYLQHQSYFYMAVDKSFDRCSVISVGLWS